MAEKLACEGGKKVNTKPFPMWPQFQASTIKAAMEPLKSGKVNYWTGTKGMEFEQKFADWNGAKYGISTANGTAALHVGLAGLGIGPGDEVICPSYSFIASSFCICQAGAVPVFADVCRDDHVIDPADIEKKISKKTRAILVVHLYGVVCQMDPIMKLAKKYNLFVVEDCAQAHGGKYKDKKVGTIGDVGCFSFCQSKHFTTGGEGGAVITDNEDVAWQCRSFRDHGYDVKERLRLLEMEAKLPYIHNMVGFNFRMTEMQSVIGLCELKRLDSFHLKNRRRNAEYLTKELSGIPEILHLPVDTKERRNAFWLYPIIMNMSKLRVDIRTFWHAIADEGVPCGPVLWPQMYKEKAYQEKRGFGRLGYPFGDPNSRPEAVDYKNVVCKNAAGLEESTFFFAIHPVYTLNHVKLMVKAFKKVVEAYRK